MSNLSPIPISSRTMSLHFLRALAVNPWSILSHSITFTKYLFGFLLILNARSLPFVWHFRVFRAVIWYRIRYRLFQWRIMFQSRSGQEKAEDSWFEGLTRNQVGSDPLDQIMTYNTWASIDDSDFNLHLSNSSYAKTLDSARFKAALISFPHFFRAGGWMPLAATNYVFLREIPIFSKYEVRMTMVAWDNKWIYLMCRFVTYPKSKSKSKAQQSSSSQPKTKEGKPTGTETPTSNSIFQASLRTPSYDITATPLESTGTPKESTPDDATKAMKAILAGLSLREEEDGAILHTVSISQLCYKIGRITVPPALVLASNGYSAPLPGDVTPYSHTNPPPHWEKAQALLNGRGGVKRYRDLMKGGWKAIPENERWWDQALGGLEERRLANLEHMNAIRKGMDGARNL